MNNKNTNCYFYFALIALGLFAVWSHSYNWDLFHAVNGYSPINYVYLWAKPENFVRDFPMGLSVMDGSSFMYIYKAFYMIGFIPEYSGYVVTGIEVFLVMLGMVILAKTFDPKYSKPALLILVLFFIASNARNMDFGRFGHPFFEGHYYNAADFLRFISIAALLSRRHILSFFLMALAFTVHATLGLMGVIFLFAAICATPKELFKPRTILAGIVFLLIAGLWAVYFLDIGKVVSSSIPTEEWLLLTRLTFHWYPVDLKLFYGLQEEIFLPFISFCILFLFALRQRSPLDLKDKRVAFGCIAMLLLVVAGVAISCYSHNPTLIKIAFQRSNDLVVLLGLVYIVPLLWNYIVSGSYREILASLGVLISPFIQGYFPGWPLLFVLLLILPSAISQFRMGEKKSWNVTLMTLSFVTVGLVVFYWLNHKVRFKSPVYYGDKDIWIVLACLPVIFVMKRLNKFFYFKHVALGLIVSVSVAFLWFDRDFVYDSSWRIFSATKTVALEKTARSYLDAQVWAKEHTPIYAVFMQDPKIEYGWRDFSQRSSFGIPRDHLMKSWLYTSDYDLYVEGKRRFAIYGYDVPKLLRENETDVVRNMLLTDIIAKFYDVKDVSWYKNLNKEFGVDFFVFPKKDIKSDLPKDFTIDYQNDDYLIASIH